MEISIHVPGSVGQDLRLAFGDSLEQVARESLALESYRRGSLSLGQIAEMLSLSQHEAATLLQQRGIASSFGMSDLNQDLMNLDRMR